MEVFQDFREHPSVSKTSIWVLNFHNFFLRELSNSIAVIDEAETVASHKKVFKPRSSLLEQRVRQNSALVIMVWHNHEKWFHIASKVHISARS